MNSRVQQEAKDKADTAADALGITLGRYIQLLVDRDPVDENGRPLWAAEVFPDLADPIPGFEHRDAA